MMKRKSLCVSLFCVMLLCLVACHQETDSIGGVPVTPEMLESVSRSLAEAKESELSPQTETAVNKTTSDSHTPEETSSDVVYWTESGSVYHITDECSSLRNSTTIHQGSVADALAAKKERPCKSCSQ